MASQKQQQLSPENYIRKKARSLSIELCMINKGWEIEGLAQILVSRKHSNGNHSFCIYLVDLFCLGVKDTFWRFNESDFEFDSFLEKFSNHGPVEKISYELAHNIIFAGLEYAEDLGIKAHKDFLRTTQYFLEEDTDAIALIDIECGQNGMPVYVKGPNDDDARVNQIIGILEKSVGPDGFRFLIDEDDYEDEDYEEEEITDKPFEKKSLEECKEIFLDVSQKKNLESESFDINLLADITDELYNRLIPYQEVNKYIDIWEEEEFSIPSSELMFTPESLGLHSIEKISETDEEHLSNIVLLKNNSRQSFQYLAKQWGEIPFLCFAKIKYYNEGDSDKTYEMIIDSLKLFPDYSLLLIEKYGYDTINDGYSKSINFTDIFKNRSELSGYEMFNFQVNKLNYYLHNKDMAALDAIYHIADDFPFWDNTYKAMLSLMSLLARVDLLREKLMNEDKKNYLRVVK